MNENKSSLIVPIAIVACLLLIAGAVYFKSQANPEPTPSKGVDLSQFFPLAEGVNLSAWRPVDGTDKIFGQPEAPIKLVVYTDLECPACKLFHQQIKLLEADYITTGQVALVYRNFPLDSLHSKARAEFQAAECVREIGGIDKYWQFVDKIFEITPSNNGLDPAKLGLSAKELGLDEKNFAACVATDKYADYIQQSVDEAIALRAKGTPFSLIVTADQVTPVYGAVQANQLSAAFDSLLDSMSSTNSDHLSSEIDIASTTLATSTEQE